MNITKQRLKQIIKEEIKRINEVEFDTSELTKLKAAAQSALNNLTDDDNKQAIADFFNALEMESDKI
jgi:hypothetical protein